MNKLQVVVATTLVLLAVACARKSPGAVDAASPPPAAPPAEDAAPAMARDAASGGAADATANGAVDAAAVPRPDASAPAALEPPKLRLARTILPKRQAITLRIDPQKTSFTGSTAIELAFEGAHDHLWLDTHHLEIAKAVLTVGAVEHAVEVVTGDDYHTGFRWKGALEAPDGAKLVIDFSGVIADTEFQGVFRQKDEEGRLYVFTQFESIHARDAFPGFDEPSFKFPYQITLEVPKDQLAFSNMPVAEEAIDGEVKRVTFAETPPLPSYLLAVAVGPFEVVDIGAGGRNQVPMRIVMPHGHQGETRFAAEHLGTILSRLEDYFDVPYPYPKLDSLIIPRFLGAMEHPGLITYAAQLLLRKPDEEGVDWRQMASSLAAHELAHQWFGNLVTLEWWDDVWLNEAFATWIGNKIVDALQPSWEVEATLANDASRAMAEDQLPSARPIRKGAERIDDIFSLFDEIAYEKGAAVIRMFEHHVGEDVFRAGMRAYIAAHAGSTATSKDFLAAIQKAAENPDFSAAFETFLDQPGVPLIALSLSCEGAPRVTLEQRRYVPTGAIVEGDARWQVPVCMRFPAASGGDETKQVCVLLKDKTLAVPLGIEGCPAWIFGNSGGKGYHRSEYRGDLLPRLLGATDRLTTSERVTLIRDLRAGVAAGLIPNGDVLALVPRFVADKSRFVVEQGIGIAIGARELVPPALAPNYGRFLAKVFGARARALGWEHKPADSDDVRLLREALVPAVAKWGRDKLLLKDAKALAEKLLKNPDAMDPSLRGQVLGAAALTGDKKLYERYLRSVEASSDAAWRRSVIEGLGWFEQALVLDALNRVLEGKFNIIESFGIFDGGLAQRETREAVFSGVLAGYDKLEKLMPRMYLPYMMRLAEWFCDAEHRDRMIAFFTPKLPDLPGGAKMMTETREAMDVCIAQRAQNTPGLEKFLAGY